VKLARTLGALGRVMITAGVLILLFVAYQLWGTGFHTQRAQDDLEQQFEEDTEAFAAEHPDPRPHDPDEPQPVPPAPGRGTGVGRIEIPAIGVNWIFLEGVGLDVLANGPGHYEGTPLPGQAGNAGIAGHRTTYGQPFHNLDQLGEGDRIIISYINGSRFTYRYKTTHIVTPDRTDVLEYKFDNRITLTACHPKYSAAERIVVVGELLEPAAEPDPGLPTAAAPELEGAESIDADEHPRTPAVVWGIAAAMVWLTAWVVGRAWRKWPVYLIALPVFLVVLYGFFENFSYLLPASY
jgi:sortase A